MSTQMIHILIAGALFVHGMGHTLGLWKPARSLFILSVPEPVLKLIGAVIWILTAAGFIASAMGFYLILVPVDWWRPLATVLPAIMFTQTKGTLQ